MRLGQAERAVYMMLEAGPLTPERSALFIRTLRSLVSAKIARRNHDGSHELVTQATPPINNRRTEPPEPISPAEPELITVSARLPVEYVEMLDRMGGTRSEALREILKRASGSGTRRRTG